ncbi:amino acid transporter heavy chain SLC3A2 [Mycteria americana]|uniref:amino acid transporter heavy chain SLC3A2 n=1 Tax=Mycteria americana TaxID=33587 RepID=UPI003F5855F2
MEADAESSPRGLELSALEAEKQPMAAAEEGGPAPPGPDPAPPGGEKNGLVKIPQDEELGGAEMSGGCKFTGLGKEELLRAAGAPPWAKARAILLFLFWLGWLGMLGAAAAIVARAPRCRPLPPRTWWELGGLYRAPPQAFAENLKGVAARLEHVAGLQVRGLVLGPLHPQTSGDPRNISLEELDPLLGSLQDFADLLDAAKKKGLQVILDLTPNSLGDNPWFGPEVAGDPNFHEKVKRALSVWLERGVAGFFLDGIEELQPSVVAEWRNLTEQNSPEGVPRVLVGGTRLRAPPALLALLNSSGVGLVLGPFLESLGSDPPASTLAPQLLAFLHPQTPLAWSVGSPRQHLRGLSPPRAPQRLLLLWALPGTPVLSYGDEVGLAEPPGGPPPGSGAGGGGGLMSMPWDLIDGIREGDQQHRGAMTHCRFRRGRFQPKGRGNTRGMSFKSVVWGGGGPPRLTPLSPQAMLLDLCRRLGALRVRERSLSLGEAQDIPASPAAAFLRSWDQSERFLVVLNPGDQFLSGLAVQDPRLPSHATLRLSTHRSLPPDPHVDLGALDLLPYEGLLLSFPYTP